VPELVWVWRPAQQYWVASTPTFTALVFRGVRQIRTSSQGERVVVWREAPGMKNPAAALYSNGKPVRYEVAIAGPAWAERGSPGYTERYVIRGSLNQVRRQLEAALERRQRAWQQHKKEIPVDAST
jgi:hypothetical protein